MAPNGEFGDKQVPEGVAEGLLQEPLQLLQRVQLCELLGSSTGVVAGAAVGDAARASCGTALGA